MDPKEITKDVDTGQNVASFDYYTGIRVAQERGLKQSTNVDEGNFMVCCGDVMFTIQSNEYPSILRRII
jgi:hypothetical protein